MAEIRITDRFRKRTRETFSSGREDAKSAPALIGSDASGAGGRTFSAFDAGQNLEDNRVISPDTVSIPGKEVTRGQEDSMSPEAARGSNSFCGPNVSLSSGAIAVNDLRKSPEEIARDIVKPLSRELKKLGYLSS